MKIFKYPLKVAGRQVASLPKGARVLALQVQREQPCIWALCEPDAPIEARELMTFPTGSSVPEGLDYVGTYQISGGALVFHVFEVIR